MYYVCNNKVLLNINLSSLTILFSVKSNNSILEDCRVLPEELLQTTFTKGVAARCNFHRVSHRQSTQCTETFFPDFIHKKLRVTRHRTPTSGSVITELPMTCVCGRVEVTRARCFYFHFDFVPIPNRLMSYTHVWFDFYLDK